MKKITVLFLLFSVTLLAQRGNYGGKPPKVTITGSILENNSNVPLEYATIVLTNLKNNKITGGVTNTTGKFEIQIPKGSYAVKVEYIGFKTKNLPNKLFSEDFNLGTILLSEDAEKLNEVEIIAEKSTVEIRLDKKIYNVGKDMTVKGGNASDVLDNVPSVNVDAEGAVSLRGNENVRILIDGKPSALVGLNGADALRNLPADAIEKVEVITSPSARYDAEGTAGILNIILRKGKITGFNGSINVTTGYPAMFRVAPNLNYRTKKFNLFSNLGYSYRKGPGNSQSYFTNLEDGVVQNYRNEDRVFDRKNNNFNGSLGMEYYLTKNSSITGSFFYRDSNGEDIATNITTNFDANNILTSTENRIENENEDGIDTQFSLNYTNNFDGKGKKLIVDLQYGDSDETELAPITENDILIEQNSQTTKSVDKLFQIDYIHPIGENSQFELGHKSTLQNLNSDFRVRDANGNPFDFDPSNAIDFKQNIYAFYAQYGNKINKFSYLLGLRTEITDIDLNVLTTNQFSDKNYTEWFPTVNFGYELNDTDNLTLGYSRRLRRPRFWFLNPFESRSSATNVFRGNPDINPMFTSSFDLGYTTKIKKLTLNSSIYYQYSTDIIQMVSIIEERNGTNVFVRQPTNLNNEQRYGFEFTSNYSPAKWARLSATFNYFKFKTDAFTYVYTTSNGEQTTTQLEAVNNNSWFTRFNARITLPAKVQWQTRIMYRGAQEDAQSERKGIFSADLSFSKDLFKEKATLVFNVRDLLNSRKRENTTYNGDRLNPTSIVDGSFQWRERQISLSFTYRFNQKKKRERPQRNYDGGGEGFGG
ncbi:Outer membrane receptor proteins, mostly Fe transport [Tenacibaculum sp. MAR_2009_124]|uniref:outer membrane beta-barrel family protein n=1 Tax=Tenacibaculum sp. MAR_2009_124 TaxID=1250059 RepID=UPI0008984F13|nr:outer membrane beta-barrel family protein [Tenacibaculum sp. MAR_2009_124]SEB38609.1 Outer membrane receptor proteins, mostly Fe transport [Tenacibaculum sp. MAR_2009_124]